MNSQELKDIKHSPFYNTYGGLELKTDSKGEYYLEIMDCFGPNYFGPLTVEQVKAFYLLCEVECA